MFIRAFQSDLKEKDSNQKQDNNDDKMLLIINSGVLVMFAALLTKGCFQAKNTFFLNSHES